MTNFTRPDALAFCTFVFQCDISILGASSKPLVQGPGEDGRVGEEGGTEGREGLRQGGREGVTKAGMKGGTEGQK